jgi:hypothetical protein
VRFGRAAGLGRGIIDGRKQVNATLTIAFPAKSEPGAGELNWGSIEGGIQACGVALLRRSGLNALR